MVSRGEPYFDSDTNSNINSNFRRNLRYNFYFFCLHSHFSFDFNFNFDGDAGTESTTLRAARRLPFNKCPHTRQPVIPAQVHDLP